MLSETDSRLELEAEVVCLGAICDAVIHNEPVSRIQCITDYI